MRCRNLARTDDLKRFHSILRRWRWFLYISFKMDALMKCSLKKKNNALSKVHSKSMWCWDLNWIDDFSKFHAKLILQYFTWSYVLSKFHEKSNFLLNSPRPDDLAKFYVNRLFVEISCNVSDWWEFNQNYMIFEHFTQTKDLSKFHSILMIGRNFIRYQWSASI